MQKEALLHKYLVFSLSLSVAKIFVFVFYSLHLPNFIEAMEFDHPENLTKCLNCHILYLIFLDHLTFEIVIGIGLV